ncbi:MAG: YitT family protein [Limnochordia bacterium]|nr:YitT family protein [Limnochordia bacterium]
MDERLKKIGSFLGNIAGVMLTGVATAAFLIPNRIAAGGVSGLATVLYHTTGIPVGVMMLAINIPLLYATFRIIGLSFSLRTIVGTILLSVTIDVLGPFIAPVTRDPLLASIYGGVLSGIGIGLAFYFGGSTGGTDLAARLMNHFTHFSIGQSLLIIDMGIIAVAGFFFGAETGLYAILALYLSTKTIDLIQEGQGAGRAAYVVSNHPEEISRRILQELERGVTALQGRGMYTNSERQVLLVIVSRSEIVRLKRLVKEEDPSAFMIITDAREVLGEGFKGF